MKSTGWKMLNNTWVYAETPAIAFTVGEDGCISGITELVIPNIKYPVRLKIVDRKAGALTSATAFPENNVVAWVSGGINQTTSWFYGFYSGDAMYPNGNLTKTDSEWIWSATFQAPPGNYEWNPCMRSLGQTGTEPRTINGNVEGVSWVGANMQFAVSPTGVVSGDTALIMDPDIVVDKIFLTVNVDMNAVSVSPQGVHVAGTFNGWSYNSRLMNDDDGDGIYTAKIEVTKSPVAPYQYKFVNGSTSSDVEVVFGECEFRSDRLAWVTDGSVEMPPVAFGYCSPHPEEMTRIKVACVGGSTTEGAGTSSKYLYSWPVVLREIIGDDYYVENLGVSGTTLQNIPGQGWKATSQYNYTKLLNPDIILMGLGGNDSKASNWDSLNFVRDYKSIIEEFRALPSSPQLYLNCTNKYRSNSFGVDDKVYVANVISITMNLAKQYMLPVMDYHSTTSPDSMASLFPDGVHPNDAGARIIAEKIGQVLLTPKPALSLETVNSPAENKYYDYCWYRNGTPIDSTEDNPALNSETIEVTESGTYNVSVKLYPDARDRIISTPFEVVLKQGERARITLKSTAVSVEPHTVVSNSQKCVFSVSPNPVTKSLQITDTYPNAIYWLYDIKGSILLETTKKVIDMSVFKSGIYFLRSGTDIVKVVKK
jgi:lysophospholipase L1-like esterase